MPEATKIEWCDHSASPWHGCSKVHAGCDHCYAEAMSKRNPGTLGVWGDDGVRVKSKSFIAALERFNRIGEQQQRVQSVFPSLCDPFEDRPELDPWRREMFATIDRLPWVRLLLLTKRPENIRRMWPANQNDGDGNRDYSPRVAEGMIHSGLRMDNVWLGTSVSDQATADRLIPELMKCRDLSPVLFVSAEPLVGPVEFDGIGNALFDRERAIRKAMNGPMAMNRDQADAAIAAVGIDWVIAGGESGPGARPCNVDWLRAIRDQCRAADVPCFIKQLGSHVIGWEHDRLEMVGVTDHATGTDSVVRWKLSDRKGGDATEWPEDLRVREFPQPEAVTHG